MKRFTLLLLAACAATLTTAQMARADSLGLAFTKYINGDGAGNDTLTVNYNGTLLDSSAITGTPDDWLIDLSSLGIYIFSDHLPQTWSMLPGESGYNILTQTGLNSVELRSGVSTPSTVNHYCGTNSPLHPGATCLAGIQGSNSVFAGVNEVAPQTPEPASMLLIAAGLAGVGIARRRLSR